MELITNIETRKIDIHALAKWAETNYLPGVAKLTVTYNDALLARLGGRDVELLGISTKTQAEGCYNIYLRSDLGASLPSVLAHELYHIYQMERGDLDYDMTSNTYTWKGDVYGDMPYEKRPWEIEARSNTFLKEFYISNPNK